MKILRTLAAAAAFTFALPAVLAAQTPAPVQLYAILPLTGNLALLGHAAQTSLQGLEKNVNATGGIGGRPLKFVYLDDATNPLTAVQLANGLPKDTAVFFDGGPLATCKATTAVLVNGPVEYCLSPALHPARGSYAFSSSVSVYDCFDATFRYLAARGWTRIATLNTTDASGQEGQTILDDLTRKYKMTNVAAERFGNTDLSVAAQVSHIEAANPQVILLGGNGAAAGNALHGLNDAGNTVPVATTNGNMINAALAAFKPFLPKTFLLAAPRWAAPETISAGPVKAAVASYLTILKGEGVLPDMGSSLAYDPALIVVTVLRKLGPSATAAQVRDEIAGMHGLAGANGFYDFRANTERGLTIKDTVVVQYDAARSTWFGVSGPGGAPLTKH